MILIWNSLADVWVPFLKELCQPLLGVKCLQLEELCVLQSFAELVWTDPPSSEIEKTSQTSRQVLIEQTKTENKEWIYY